MDFNEPQKEDYLPGAASFVFRIQQIDSEIAAKQNAELREAVEDFAEHVYAEGSEVDGLKLIFNNPQARAAFIKYLNSDKDGKILDPFSRWSVYEMYHQMN